VALLSTGPDERYRAVLDPRRLLRWIYIGRLSLATASFIAALLVTLYSDPASTLIATTMFVTAMALTGLSFVRTEVNRRTPGQAFLYAQFVHDLVLITTVVHLTEGAVSPFTALYILAMAAAAILLPVLSALLLALLGIVLYVGDAVLVSEGDITVTLVLQLVVFTLVALGTAYIAARLQAAGEGRARLQAELARMQLRAADILDNIRAGIVTVDRAGRLLYANPGASTLMGAPLAERLGAPVLDFLRETAPGVADALQVHRDAGLLTNRSEGVVVRGGRAIPLGITTTSVSGDLKQEGDAITAIFQDISDQKRIEALNLRAQRLEAVAELSASLAHEIKNPLASIRSAVEQISRRSAASADEQTLGTLIVRESDRLSRLLSEFLDFARVQVARRAPVDLRVIVQGAAALAGTHPDRGPQVRLTLDIPDEPQPIEGDEDLLHRAVFNLILNAVQASPEEGEVRVSMRRTNGMSTPSGIPFRGPALEVEVRDQGAGIPKEIEGRLFEPFNTTKVGGSGLGLAIVHRAIEAHRGVILVDSDRAGTRFTVLMPIDPSSAGATP
jgi:two-component system sensor histidine kinase PilS (NtrC family)